MKKRIIVEPREEIRDPEGEAIADAARSLGFPVKTVRTGRVFTIETTEKCLPDEIRRLADELLANPVAERFEIE